MVYNILPCSCYYNVTSLSAFLFHQFDDVSFYFTPFNNSRGCDETVGELKGLENSSTSSLAWFAGYKCPKLGHAGTTIAARLKILQISQIRLGRQMDSQNAGRCARVSVYHNVICLLQTFIRTEAVKRQAQISKIISLLLKN